MPPLSPQTDPSDKMPTEKTTLQENILQDNKFYFHPSINAKFLLATRLHPRQNPHFCYISLYIRCKAHNVKICLCLHKIILLPFRCALHLLYILLYKLLYYPMCVSVYVTAHINCYWKTSYMCWVCFYIYGKCCLCAAKSTRSYS